MKYDHFNARVLLVDGPLKLSICEAPAQEIVDAYERLFRLVRVAAVQLDTGNSSAELEKSVVEAFINRSGNAALEPRPCDDRDHP